MWTLDRDGKALTRYPASLGSEHDPLPLGQFEVKGISRNPIFSYNPDLFWDADPSHAKAKLPPARTAPWASSGSTSARAPRHPRNARPAAVGRRSRTAASASRTGRGRARRARARGDTGRAGHAVVKDVLRSVVYGVIVLVPCSGPRISPPGPGTEPQAGLATPSRPAPASSPGSPRPLCGAYAALSGGGHPRTRCATPSRRAARASAQAVDILAPRGTRVLAVDDGRVVKLFNSVRAGSPSTTRLRADLLLLLRPPRRLRPLARGRCPRPKRCGARIRGHDRQRTEGHAAPPLQHLQARPRAALVGGHADQPVRDLGFALRRAEEDP